MKRERNGLVGGGFAYLDGRRDGATLWWNGISVLFAFNTAGSSWTRVEAPERFGGIPTTWREFAEFARRFAA